MNSCSCCQTKKDPAIGKPAGFSQISSKCAYCSGFPRTALGGCWGMHGHDLHQYVSRLVNTGRLSQDAAHTALEYDGRRLVEPWH